MNKLYLIVTVDLLDPIGLRGLPVCLVRVPRVTVGTVS